MLKNIREIRERGSPDRSPGREMPSSGFELQNEDENGERSPAYLSFGGEYESISHRLLLFLDRSPSLSFINHLPRLSFARAYYRVVLTAARICKNAME